MNLSRAFRPARALLAAFTVAAVVGVLALRLAIHFLDGLDDGPDPRYAYGYSFYLDVATLWALALGVLGICSLTLQRWKHRPTALRDLALCDLALVLALLWPIQLLLAAAAFASRTRQRRRRWSTLTVGVVLFLGGTTWGAVAYERGHPWTAGGGNTGPLMGDWHDAQGGVLSLRPGGEFTATSPGSDAMWPWDPQRVTGHWALTTSPREGAALSLVPSEASGEDDSVQFDAYGILSPSSLCLEYGLEQPCDLALHR